MNRTWQNLNVPVQKGELSIFRPIKWLLNQIHQAHLIILSLFVIAIRNRSQFVQSLLLSTLSIIDVSDANEQNSKPENEASELGQLSEDGTANTMSFDSVTLNAPMAARASNYDDTKKKQESASHSDLDSHPQHLSGKFFCS